MILNLNTYLRTSTVLLTISLSSCGLFKPKKIEVEEPPMPPIVVKPVKPMPNGKTDAFLLDILKKDNFVATILNNPETYNAQIIYTQIDRDANNIPSFKELAVNADPNFYFYPASTVKMPIAFLALQKINELNAKGIPITKNSTMLTGSNTSLQSVVFNDPTTADGRPTIAHYIKKIFLVSDNDAYNRLYEFLGQEYINSSLQRLGFKSTEILHRLEISLPLEENKKTNPIKFLDDEGKVIYEQAPQINTRIYAKRNTLRGNGFMQNGTLVNKPFDFSAKNRINLNDLNAILRAVIFAKNTTANQQFNLTESDRNFCLQYMSQLPRETLFPSYNPAEVWDTYIKFNYFGSEKVPIPSNIRIFNKPGDAYGYFTDVAYIVDFENNIEFIVSATIYANKDEIFNDNKYDEKDVAMPFLKKVGQLLYAHEKGLRKNAVDLSEFKLVYDK
jgi:hypothetical protein